MVGLAGGPGPNSTAAVSGKPHYLLHTRAGQIDRPPVDCLRAAGIPIVAGMREGLLAIDRLGRGSGWKSNIG